MIKRGSYNESNLFILNRMPELTLYQGDCLKVMKELPAQSVDLIICDLPYGCLAGGAGKEKQKRQNKVLDLRYNTGKTKPLNTYGGTLGSCQWDVKIDLEEFWKEVKRIRKNEHTPCIHFCTTRFGIDLINSNPTEFRYDLVWNKQVGVSFLSANKMPMRSHEMIYVFSKTGAFYNRVDITGDFKKWQGKRDNRTGGCYGGAKRSDTDGGDGTRCVLSVIDMKKCVKLKQLHPTEKPNELYKWLIERYCPVGGTILDPTFGSGNSVFTAYALGRDAIGIEMDEEFFNKATNRLQDLP